MRISGTSSWQALRLLSRAGDAARSGEAAAGNTRNGSAQPSSPFGRTSAQALSAILDLTAKPSASREQEAMALVKGWVRNGLFPDAASGRDDAGLQALAREGRLDDLPALSGEQEATLSTRELRVYVEARYWHAQYDGMPRTLAQAKTDFVKQTLSSLPEAIGRIDGEIAAGTLRNEEGQWDGTLADMKAQLRAAREGRMTVEPADPSLVRSSSHNEFARDASGLIIGGGGQSMTVDNDALAARYAGRHTSFGFSDHLGAYVISW